MLERYDTRKRPERAGRPVAARMTHGAVLAALLCLLVPAVLVAQDPPPTPKAEAFEDSLRREIRLRQERLEQLRETVRTSDDEEIAEALVSLQTVISELESELMDIQVKVDENAILFSNTSGDLRIEIPEDLGTRVSEGLSAVTAAIMAEIPDSVDVQREIQRWHQAADGWNWDIFGEDQKPRKRKVVGNDLFAMSKDLVVAVDERVTGDVVVLLGDATILGEVDGAVTVVGGELILGEDCEIHGEATVVFGELLRDEDATIDGNVHEISTNSMDYGLGVVTEGPAGIAVKLTGLAVLAVLVLLTMLLLPSERVEGVHAALVGAGARSFFVGAVWFVFGHLLLLIVLVVLIATVIGIPLALLVGLAYVLFGLLAVGVVTRALGRRFCGAGCSESTVLPVLLGVAIISLPGLVGAVTRTFLPAGDVLGDLLLLLGICVHALVYCLGAGAVLMSRAGGRRPSGI